MSLKKLNIRKWTYNGMKLNNPVVILWKLIWYVPLQISLVFTCLFALIAFGRYSAKAIWDEVN